MLAASNTIVRSVFHTEAYLLKHIFYERERDRERARARILAEHSRTDYCASWVVPAAVDFALAVTLGAEFRQIIQS